MHEHGRGDHSHSHAVSAGADVRYLSAGLALIVTFMVVEVIAATLSGSLALLADAGHMLTDAGAIGASIWAARLSARPAAGRWTYGFKRAEVLSAQGNGITLLVAAAIVGFEAVRRLISPPAVQGSALLIVAVAGVAVNLVVMLVLARADRSSMNIDGAFQHIVTDLYAFVGTAVAGGVILTTDFRRADPIASLLVVALMLRAGWRLLGQSGEVLLEAAPKDVDLAAIVGHLGEAPHVLSVHDLHVWTVASNLPALSAHVVVEDSCFTDGHAPQILDEIQHCLIGHFAVEHSTFQLEPASHVEHERGHHS